MPEKLTAASVGRSIKPVEIELTRSDAETARAGVQPALVDSLATRRLRLAAAEEATLRAIVDRLLLVPASAAEVAADLDLDAQAVRHLLRRLVKGGVVTRGAKSHRRGVSEFLYSCDPRRAALSSENLEGLPADQVERALARVVRGLFREAMAASHSGSFFARDDFVIVRFPLPLDEPGWGRAGHLHRRLLDSIAEVRGRAGARLACGADPIDATAGVLLYEIPGTRWPPPFAEGQTPSAQVRRRSNRRRLDAVIAHADPLRARIADVLTLNPATAVEIAAQIGAPLETVRYELRALARAEMVRVHCRRERRGAIENVFIADNPKMTFLSADLPGASDRALREFGIRWVRETFGEVVEAIRDGRFRDAAQWQLTRTPLRLDPQGFVEISTAMAATVEELYGLREECLSRRANGAHESRPAFSDLLLFEQAIPTFGGS